MASVVPGERAGKSRLSADPEPDVLRIQLLGPVRAWVGPLELALGPPLQVAVFAALALGAPRAVSRAGLVAALWGEDGPANAEGSVYTYISGLRGALADAGAGGGLARSAGGYVLQAPAVDVALIEADLARARVLQATGDPVAAADVLSQCLDEWHGPVLQGCPGPLADGERLRLQALRLLLVEERAELLLGLGRERELAAELAIVVRAEPLRERLRAMLMTALYRDGRQAEALAEYESLRLVLASELGIDPSPQVFAVYEQILRADPELLAALPTESSSATPPAASSPAPVGIQRVAQLPREVSHFVGRSAELELLEQSSAGPPESPAAVVISAIDGVGGVGKTALAVRFAHRVADNFPDGQVFVNLRGYDPRLEPLSVSEALSQVLVAMGAGRLPIAEDELGALYRSRLAGRRMLIVLDNARSVAQVRSLLPGSASCLVVVTSRSRLSGLVVRDGARRVTLGVLSPAESVALLRLELGAARVEAEQQAAEAIARLCGYLPLALRVVAERALVRPVQALAELVEELANEQGRLDAMDLGDDEMSSVRGVLSWSYHSQPPEQAAAFRRLGWYPGQDVAVSAAAALLGLPLPQARRVLAGLVQQHLLEEPVVDRFRFHDLVRLYAVERAGADEGLDDRHAAIERLTVWYLQTALNALSTTAESLARIRRADFRWPVQAPERRFDRVEDAFDWYQSEAASFLPVLEQAADSGHHDAAWQLAQSLFDYYYSAGSLTDWLEVTGIGLESVRALGNRLGEASMLNNRSVAFSRLGRNEEAVTCLHQALRITTDEDASVRGVLLANLASTLREMGRYEEGVPYALEALSLADRTDDLVRQFGALDTLCELFVDMRRPDEALRHANRALLLPEVGVQKQIQANLRVNMAHAHRDDGNAVQALEAYESALQFCRSGRDRYHEAMALRGLAELHHRYGEKQLARQRATEALDILDELNAEEADEVRAFLRTVMQIDQAISDPV